MCEAQGLAHAVVVIRLATVVWLVVTGPSHAGCLVTSDICTLFWSKRNISSIQIIYMYQ